MKIKIEKNVPVPERSKYPWKQMKVGDSFFVKGIKGIAAMAQQYGVKHNSKFCTRLEKGGIRVWRIQ